MPLTLPALAETEAALAFRALRAPLLWSSVEEWELSLSLLVPEAVLTTDAFLSSQGVRVVCASILGERQVRLSNYRMSGASMCCRMQMYLVKLAWNSVAQNIKDLHRHWKMSDIHLQEDLLQAVLCRLLHLTFVRKNILRENERHLIFNHYSPQRCLSGLPVRDR